MRTTIRLDDALLRQAKAMAAMQGRSLNEFIVDAIRASVSLRAVRERQPLPTFKGKGLQYGVDLDSSSALLDLMEGANTSSVAGRAARVAEGDTRKQR